MSDTQTNRTKFQWRIWYPAFGGSALFFGLLTADLAFSPTTCVPVTDWDVVLVLSVGIAAALGGLGWSIVRYGNEMRRRVTDLNIETFLDDSELSMVILCGYCAGYRGGWYYGYVGGFLGLTDSELVFRTGPEYLRNYDWRISLVDVRSVERCRIRRNNCGMRVTGRDGTARFFLFSIWHGTATVDRVAQAIWFARNRLTN